MIDMIDMYMMLGKLVGWIRDFISNNKAMVKIVLLALLVLLTHAAYNEALA